MEESKVYYESYGSTFLSVVPCDRIDSITWRKPCIGGMAPAQDETALLCIGRTELHHRCRTGDSLLSRTRANLPSAGTRLSSAGTNLLHAGNGHGLL